MSGALIERNGSEISIWLHRVFEKKFVEILI